MKIHSQNDVDFTFTGMGHRVISVGGRECETGRMDWAQGTSRVATKIPGPHAPIFFFFRLHHVKSFVCHIRQRNINDRQIWLLLVETSHARLHRTCSMLCVVRGFRREVDEIYALVDY